MAEYIENPRRAPRAPVRCEARVAVRPGGYFAGPTTDVGPGGCQVPTPVPFQPGARVFVELAHERLEAPCALSGRIAWSRNDAPGGAPARAGIAFDDGAAAPAGRFFERLAAAHPELDPAAAPDRIAVDAPLAPAPPPPNAIVLDEEAIVLRAVGEGIAAGALRDRLGQRFSRLVNPLFALLGRRVLVVGPPDPAAAEAWAARLGARGAPAEEDPGA